MDRFLVCSGHTRREPPQCFIIEAPSAKRIIDRYPVFAGQRIFRLPDERPDWLTDEHLAVLERNSTHQLGKEESRMLAVLLDHVAQGHTWQWYELEQRPGGADAIAHGELGTFRQLRLGDDVGGLPHKAGRWHVVAVGPPPHAGVTAKLVIAPSEAD
jgi:hypothetical protein